MSNPWHLRVWRRVKVAPGLTVNLSKSGPSLSVGPRGSKITFGRRGVRQTIGLPGTGLYATRQLSARPPADPVTQATAAAVIPPVATVPAPAAAPETSQLQAGAGQYEIHYGMPLVVAVAIGLVVAASGQPTTVSVATAILAFTAGLFYEALAAHHPLAAKVLAQVAVAVVAVVTVLAGVVLVLAAAGVGASARTGRRR